MPDSRRFLRALACLLFLAAWLPRIAAAQAQYHVVEKGETLYSVARSYGVKPGDLAAANSIDDPAKIRAGMRLLIPRDSAAVGAAADSGDPAANSGATDAAGSSAAEGPAGAPSGTSRQKYKVVKGDTLYSIARAFKVKVEAIRAANGLKAASVIKPGDSLTIPGSGSPSGAASQDPAGAGVSPTSAAAQASRPSVPDAVKTSAKAVSKGLSWPCPGEIVYLDGKVYGVVIRAKLGESERAIAAGTVSSAGPYRGYGSVVFVLSRGYIYVYGGNETVSVRAGDRVTAGQELGKIGMDAKQGGPAAYFLVFKNGAAVDPAAAPRD